MVFFFNSNVYFCPPPNFMPHLLLSWICQALFYNLCLIIPVSEVPQHSFLFCYFWLALACSIFSTNLPSHIFEKVFVETIWGIKWSCFSSVEDLFALARHLGILAIQSNFHPVSELEFLWTLGDVKLGFGHCEKWLRTYLTPRALLCRSHSKAKVWST